MQLGPTLPPVKQLPCPNCLSYTLEFEPRSGPGYSERVRVARCEGCGYPLLFDGPIEQRMRRAIETLEMGRCPLCGSGDTKPGIFSQTRSHQSLLLGQCRTCHRQFAPGMAA